MRRSRIVISLVAVVIAIVLQTTVFGAGRIEPLGVAPALVTLVIVAVAPYVEAEITILLGFTGGILMDLIGSGTLGLWAMSLTIVAYIASRVSYRYKDSVWLSLAAVFVLTVLGQSIYVVLGTLFGQETATEPNVASKILLPALWNVILGYPVLWLARVAFRTRDRSWVA
ncbi:MAG: rod shape-determining protein MreD [Acidimicrobiia bacterium]|nr:rod shape-determining protein MreD [Acidimicrobiia bacterium]